VLEDGSASTTFTVHNVGSADIQVIGLDHVAGDHEVFSTDAPAIIELAPSEQFEVEVTFTPDTSRAYDAQIFPSGLATLQLEGVGTAPVLYLSPSELDLGAVPLGCSTVSTLQVLNAGDEDLDVWGVGLTSSGDFGLGESSPVTLAPGHSQALDLSFTPSFGGPQSTVLQVSSNDPLAPVSSLELSALGYEGSAVRETFSYDPTAEADLMLVVDSSSTVGSRLREALPFTQGFLEGLDAVGVLWQVALVSPDLDCMGGAAPWLSWENGAASAADVLNSELPRQGFGTSQLLELAATSLERTDSGDCLEGFVRPGAQLHAVLIGDREERSPESAADYVQAMQERMSDPDDLVVSAIMGEGSDGGCQDLGQADDAVAATGGVQRDLCGTGSWEGHFDALTQVSSTLTSPVDTYQLAEDAVLSTLEVYSDGRTLTAWTYEEASRTLLVDGAAEDLEPGAEIAVHYVQATICSD